MKPQFKIEQSAYFPSFYVLWRNIPHVGPKFEFSGFMDDFGFLVPIDFKALAIHLQEERRLLMKSTISLSALRYALKTRKIIWIL